MKRWHQRFFSAVPKESLVQSALRKLEWARIMVPGLPSGNSTPGFRRIKAENKKPENHTTWDFLPVLWSLLRKHTHTQSHTQTHSKVLVFLYRR